MSKKMITVCMYSLLFGVNNSMKDYPPISKVFPVFAVAKAPLCRLPIRFRRLGGLRRGRGGKTRQREKAVGGEWERHKEEERQSSCNECHVFIGKGERDDTIMERECAWQEVGRREIGHACACA